MNRREFLSRSTTATFGMGLGCRLRCEPLSGSDMPNAREASGAISSGTAESVLTGTAPLTVKGDLAKQMVDGIHRFLLHETERQARERENRWSRDYGSAEKYERSVAHNRQRFREIVGAADERVSARAPELVGSLRDPAHIAQGPTYKVYSIRWQIFAPETA